jgi:hypothetical protein
MAASGEKLSTTIVIGTVKGDLHDMPLQELIVAEIGHSESLRNRLIFVEAAQTQKVIRPGCNYGMVITVILRGRDLHAPAEYECDAVVCFLSEPDFADHDPWG